MRIWDVPPAVLCRQHLLGEHRELHALWTILTKNKKGYRGHPETKRWVGKEKALYLRHEEEVKEMQKREYAHHSPLDEKLATGSPSQDVYIDSPKKQKEILRAKPCSCI